MKQQLGIEIGLMSNGEVAVVSFWLESRLREHGEVAVFFFFDRTHVEVTR